MIRVVAPLAALGLVLTAVASASQGVTTSKITVTLMSSLVVPKPTNVPAGARGSFVGRFSNEGHGLVKFEYRVSFSRASGPATGIHIHLGKRGSTGPVLVSLCNGSRCSGPPATFGHLSHALVEELKTGAYVDVHTTENPRGELRGQLTGISIG